MFGQNQDDQQAVVPPPDDLVNAPVNTTVNIPEPDDPNVIKPDTASTELEPEIQPLDTPKEDDLVIPNDIKDEDVVPDALPEPIQQNNQQESSPTINISEEGNPSYVPTPTTNEPSEPVDVPTPTVNDSFDPTNAPTPTDNDSPDSANLDELKRKALEDLSPLVDELDQTPEEKFQTTMMMIQAADNKDLLPKAYEAAKTIEDDKAKAQALLDVINEINYFSQR